MSEQTLRGSEVVDANGRRTVLRALALLGVGAVAGQAVGLNQAVAQTVAPTPATPPPTTPAQPAAAPAAPAATKYGPPSARGPVAEVYQKARAVLYPVCRVCPQCDGVACAGEVPGIGGIGSGRAFQNNSRDLGNVELRMRLVNGSGPLDKKPDTSTVLFGQKLSLPAMAAPIGGVTATFGKRLSDVDFFEAMVGGSAAAGTLGAIGDSPLDSREVLQARFDVIGRHKGRAIACIKPRQPGNIIELIRLAEAQKAAVVAVDIDSAGRYGRVKDPQVELSTKTVAELRQIVRSTKIPFVLKGVMTVQDALLAAEAGCAGIVVSNHGGRVLDSTPGTAKALPAIVKKVGGRMTVLVDGCVQNATDIVKYLALGAHGVLIGRHLVRAVYGGGAKGVQLFLETMRKDLERAMVMAGAQNVRGITGALLA